MAGMNTALNATNMDSRRLGKFLYWQGWRVTEIAEYVGEKEPTVHSWKKRDEWDRADNVERIGGALEARLVQLILKEGKSGGDFKEIDLLHRQLERQARIQRYQDGGTETDLNPKIANRNTAERKRNRATNTAKSKPNASWKRSEIRCSSISMTGSWPAMSAPGRF